MSAPIHFYVISILFAITFLFFDCKDTKDIFNDPLPYLETEDIPQCIRKLSFYGINGQNYLKGSKTGETVEIRGVYGKGMVFPFIRIFNDTGLYYIPLDDTLSYPPERSLIRIRGLVSEKNDPFLSETEVLSVVDIGKVKDAVEKNFRPLVEKISDRVHKPKSKLDLGSIKEFHCASSDSSIMVFGRTYDLMYEFDVGVLVQFDCDSVSFKKIYAWEFFKGE